MIFPFTFAPCVPPMHLYNFTIKNPTGVVCCVAGSFSAEKVQEILVSRGKMLELLRADETGKLQSVLTWQCFGLVRNIAPFRLPGLMFD